MLKLDEFDVVLILEGLNSGLELMKHYFGWKRISAPRGNAHKKSSKDAKITEKGAKEYEYMVMYDKLLYDYARFLNARQLQGISERKRKYEGLKCGDACCCSYCNRIECYKHPFSFLDPQTSYFCSKWR